jgi:hypothetical protein
MAEVVPVQCRITEPSAKRFRVIAPYGALHEKTHAEGPLWGKRDTAMDAIPTG